jgi:hypothetical protein
MLRRPKHSKNWNVVPKEEEERKTEIIIPTLVHLVHHIAHVEWSGFKPKPLRAWWLTWAVAWPFIEMKSFPTTMLSDAFQCSFIVFSVKTDYMLHIIVPVTTNAHYHLHHGAITQLSCLMSRAAIFYKNLLKLALYKYNKNLVIVHSTWLWYNIHRSIYAKFCRLLHSARNCYRFVAVWVNHLHYHHNLVTWNKI